MTWGERLMFALVGLLLAATLGLLVFVAYDAIVADYFSLRKDSWVCSRSHQETTMILMQVGQVQVPQFLTTTVCDQWTKGTAE